MTRLLKAMPCKQLFFPPILPWEGHQEVVRHKYLRRTNTGVTFQQWHENSPTITTGDALIHQWRDASHTLTHTPSNRANRPPIRMWTTQAPSRANDFIIPKCIFNNNNNNGSNTLKTGINNILAKKSTSQSLSDNNKTEVQISASHTDFYPRNKLPTATGASFYQPNSVIAGGTYYHLWSYKCASTPASIPKHIRTHVFIYTCMNTQRHPYMQTYNHTTMYSLKHLQKHVCTQKNACEYTEHKNPHAKQGLA